MIIGALALLAGCLADLRPDHLDVLDKETDARALLEEACRNHGLTVWKEHQTYTVKLADTFVGLKGWYANSFREKPVELECRFAIGRFEGEIEFLSGKKKGQVWGIMNDKTYKILPDGAHVTKDNKHIRFWVQNIQYYLEFPLRILEADVMKYAGNREWKDQKYDLVLVSWNTAEPQKDIDQILIWINRSTTMIDKIQYTARDYFGWFRGTSVFENLTNFAGLQIPTSIPVFSKRAGKGKIHHMRFSDFRFMDSDDIPLPESDTSAITEDLAAPLNSSPGEAHVEVSRSALDRNCGSCHHSNRSTNTVALAIFDLANPCWYCTISEEQFHGLESRTQSSEEFTEAEKEAILQVIASHSKTN